MKRGRKKGERRRAKKKDAIATQHVLVSRGGLRRAFVQGREVERGGTGKSLVQREKWVQMGSGGGQMLEARESARGAKASIKKRAQ